MKICLKSISNKPKTSKFYLALVIILLKIVFADLKDLNTERYLKNQDSDIVLVVQGSGVQNLFGSYYEGIYPSEVLVNGIKDDSCSNQCTLQGDTNIITLRFQTQIVSYEYMFYYLANIIEVDLSNFDASKVTTMYNMFCSCTNLKKINFWNINTSYVESLRMFVSSCTNLISID